MSQHRWGGHHLIATAAAIGISALLLGSPAAADPVPAGTVSVQSACYVNTARAAAQVTITGTGWEPGATIAISDKLDKLTATATASTSGTFMVAVPAPVIDSTAGSVTTDAIIASYAPDPAQPTGPSGPTATSAPFQATNFAVLLSGNRSRARAHSTFHLSGFRSGQTVYAHYLTASGTLLGTVALGRPAGPCGVASISRVLFPFAHPRGRRVIQFDGSRRYRRTTSPQYRLALVITRL